MSLPTVPTPPAAGFYEAIGARERDAWLRGMRVALDDAGLAEPHREQLWSYLESTANHMINRRE